MRSHQRFPEHREGKYRVREISKYIVAHEGICHGQPTFRGTRVLTHLALESLQEPGQTVEAVARDYGLPVEAIADARRVAADWYRYRLCLPHRGGEPPSEQLRVAAPYYERTGNQLR
jgi:uncharacterized protein (DUF433 family)